MTRIERQQRILAWAIDVFGHHKACTMAIRGNRFLEEAIEVAQAAGVHEDVAHHIVKGVYSRKTGQLKQEIGAAGITLLSLAELAGIDADHEEAIEMYRVFGIPKEEWTARERRKLESGFNAVVTHTPKAVEGD